MYLKQITPHSRYYKDLKNLLNIIDAANFFSKHYNEDKERYSFNYNYETYENEIHPDRILETLKKRIFTFLLDGIYTYEEQLLLLSELYLNVKEYGKMTTDSFRSILDRYKKANELNQLNNNNKKYYNEILASYVNLTKVKMDLIEYVDEYYKKIYEKWNSINNPSTVLKSDLSINNKSIKMNSFKYKKYNSNISAITDLFNFLIDKKFISEKTKLKEFRKIFSDTSIEIPIIWTGNISELSYFIKQLHNDRKIVDDTKLKHWEITIKCFVNSESVCYEKSKLRNQIKPSSYKVLDAALNLL
jgi:hypothetical protein